MFVVRGTEISSSEGTAQGDPIAGLVYAIAIIPMILRTVQNLQHQNTNTKAAAYADDLFGGGKLRGLRCMWDFIEEHGPGYGYFQQATKTWIIVKPQYLDEAKALFQGTNIQITSEGKKHLGVTIRSAMYRKEYSNSKIDIWTGELSLLSEIAAYAPHEAYTCFTFGYKHKLNFCMRTSLVSMRI